MPDHSDTFKVVQRATHFKAMFSMAVEHAIADIALTTKCGAGIGPLYLGLQAPAKLLLLLI